MLQPQGTHLRDEVPGIYYLGQGCFSSRLHLGNEMYPAMYAEQTLQRTGDTWVLSSQGEAIKLNPCETWRKGTN